MPKSLLADKELNTEQLLDITFWLKPWLKSISFGFNFFHLAKVLATTNSGPGLALGTICFAFLKFFRHTSPTIPALVDCWKSQTDTVCNAITYI